MPHFFKNIACCFLIAAVASCNKTATITVYVKQGTQPLTGAHVAVQSLPDCKNITGKEVSAQGIAIFELKNGYYNVGAWGPMGTAMQDSFQQTGITLSKGKSREVTFVFP